MDIDMYRELVLDACEAYGYEMTPDERRVWEGDDLPAMAGLIAFIQTLGGAT